MSTSSAPRSATSVTVAGPANSWIGRLQRADRDRHRLGRAAGLADGEVEVPGELVIPVGLSLQTSRNPLGVTLLVKVTHRLVRRRHRRRSGPSPCGPPGSTGSRSSGRERRRSSRRCTRDAATSVTVTVPAGSVIGRLQQPTGTSMMPATPCDREPEGAGERRARTRPCRSQASRSGSGWSAWRTRCPTAPTTEMVVTTSAAISSRSRPTRLR